MVQGQVSSGDASPVPDSPRQVGGFAALDACHRRVLARIAELSALVTAIEAGDITPAMRASAAAIAQVLGGDARRHHEDEELHVFPPLLASNDAELVQNVLRLQQDHGWLEQDWLELAPHVQALATGYGTCDVDELRGGTAILVDLYREHIELEESIVYPAARERIGAAAQDKMAREMIGRRRAERAGRRAGSTESKPRNP
jgi:hemerythrin-like domain-containing protein